MVVLDGTLQSSFSRILQLYRFLRAVFVEQVKDAYEFHVIRSAQA